MLSVVNRQLMSNGKSLSSDTVLTWRPERNELSYTDASGDKLVHVNPSDEILGAAARCCNLRTVTTNMETNRDISSTPLDSLMVIAGKMASVKNSIGITRAVEIAEDPPFRAGLRGHHVSQEASGDEDNVAGSTIVGDKHD